MKQQTSPAIILRRTNYGEADRIITFLTPVGKVRALVKGVRRSKSKLAGGIELFSESTITFMETRGNLARIISTRLNVYWDTIVGDLQRMMFGYEAMKLLDSLIEEEAERDYFELLKDTLETLNDLEVPLSSVEVWFYARFLKLSGHEPNTTKDTKGKKLEDNQTYQFSTDNMSFFVSSQGEFKSEHIKFLRLCLQHKPTILKQIKSGATVSAPLKNLLQQLIKLH